MKNLMSKTLFIFSLLLIASVVQVNAQTKCCSSKKGATADAKACGTASNTATADASKTACCASKSSGAVETLKAFFTSNSNSTEAETTSGCNPSSCRGAKTKFGEAKVVSNLRLNLIELKGEMETYKKVEFPQRSYDIHGIVGETDEESLAIIEKEVKIVEALFVEKFNLKLATNEIPTNKAKKVKYLSERIDLFKNTL